ncbi:MAG: hypothetical protein JWN78_204 [Bacteroidota bacterium]|nr:hypothetical protein [Bacteroidota bacterium]
MRCITIFLFCIISVSLQLLHAQNRYYKTETHCHSSNSGDGFISPADLLQDYKSRGYKIVFMSDHDTMTDVEAMNFPGIFSINSEELSCGSHFNGFNMKATVPACGMSNQQKVDAILAQDALVCVNHPVAPRWRITAKEILALQGKISFVEIYNPTDLYEAADDQSLWDSLLTAGWHTWGISSGDVHQFLPLEDIWIGYSMIHVDTLTKDAVLDAMLGGDFYASTGVELKDYKVSGDTINVSCTNCFRIIFWGDNHTILKQANTSSLQYIRQPGDQYVRAELILDRFNKAWTQPVFFDLTTAINNHKNIPPEEIYPNPSGGQFKFYYYLEDKNAIDIALYDLQGKLVRKIFSGAEQSGRHDLLVDVEDLPNGTYFLKMQSEQFSISKPVSIFK